MNDNKIKEINRLDVYELLRQAHSNMKIIGGNCFNDKVIFNTAMISENIVPKLSYYEKKKSFKLIDEIRERLYSLEKIYAKQ